MRSTLNRMRRDVEELDARTKKLGSKATLARLKEGPTPAVDIIGEPPELYLEALLQGVSGGFTATVRTHDEALLGRLVEHGGRVWVGPPPGAEEHPLLHAYQEEGVLEVWHGGEREEKRTWQPADKHSRARHQLNLRDFAPYDGDSVASSLDDLPKRKRAALERRVSMSPQAFVWQTALLMTLLTALPVLGGLLCAVGFVFSMWQVFQDGSLLLPFLITISGFLLLLGTRVVNNRLEVLLGPGDGPGDAT